MEQKPDSMFPVDVAEENDSGLNKLSNAAGYGAKEADGEAVMGDPLPRIDKQLNVQCFQPFD